MEAILDRGHISFAGSIALLALGLLAASVARAQPVVTQSGPTPQGDVSVSYSLTLTATDTTLPCVLCTWAISAGSPPAGLGLSSTSGSSVSISGTPTSDGTSMFTVQATDLLGSGTLDITITINPALGISPASLPAGQQGAFYSVSISATNGTSPGAVMLTGALPTGLNFNAGLLSGTPMQTGTFPLVASVTDSVGGTASANYSLQINPPPPPALVLQTSSLPSGEAGAPYSAPLSATGGVPPYSWSANGLPHGLRVDPSTGIISGPLAPDATTSTNVVLKVTDSTNTPASSPPLTLTVTPGPTITGGGNLPAAEATAPYSQTLTATGGTTPFTWTVTDGSLPVGLSLNPTSGTISGTPTTTGSFNFTVTLTDSLGVSAPSKAFKLKVTGGLGITTPSPLPQGEVTIPYSQTLTASGGTNSGFTWAITSGLPPAGLSLSAGGVLSGTPTAAGSSNFTVQVTDSGGGNATQNFSLTIIAALTITTNPTLPQGEVGAAYSQTLTATGGQAPHVYTWSVISGSLPAGFALTAGGVLSGTPGSTALGTASFTVRATDSAGGTATLPMSLAIIAGPTITTAPTLPNGTVGGTYTTTLAASDGTKPYIWSITLGVLPAGLSLDANAGTISGTAKVTGASNFTVQVIDAKGVTATKQFSITISGGLTITTAPGLRNASIGLAYSATLSAAGGTPPYTWIVNSGSLPTGLTLNSSTGAISGLPSSSGSFKFTVQVTDSASGTATKQFTLNVTQTLVITTAPTLPGGAVGTQYLQSLSAVGGTQPYTFTVVSGLLPNGVNLSPGGVISGTPASSGTFNFTIQVRDSNSITASQPFSLTVVSSLSITTAPQLPQGAINSQYSADCSDRRHGCLYLEPCTGRTSSRPELQRRRGDCWQAKLHWHLHVYHSSD